MATTEEKQIIRELAKQYMEYATSQRQQRADRRATDTNDLKPGRPPVVLNEIPWIEMNIGDELICRCEDKGAQKLETYLRRALYYYRHFPYADALYEPFYRIHQTVHSTGIGVERPKYHTAATEGKGIVSKELSEDLLEDESMLEKFRIPEFSLDPERDEKNVAYYTDLLGDTMPVVLDGIIPQYLCAWDNIAFLRGMEPIFFDLYDRPEYLLAILEKHIAAANAELDFREAHQVADPTYPSVHCTPAKNSGLMGNTGLKATWFRDNAQPLGNVAPDMFGEFAVDPILQLASRFGYTYFGCCEPLYDKIEQVKKIPNLRKVGVSPWSKVEESAEQLRGDYVFARKPNPANVAIKTDPDVIRKETEETVKACIKYGCPYELVLKDISTVSNDPNNLILWQETVNEVLDRYYDKA